MNQTSTVIRDQYIRDQPFIATMIDGNRQIMDVIEFSFQEKLHCYMKVQTKGGASRPKFTEKMHEDICQLLRDAVDYWCEKINILREDYVLDGGDYKEQLNKNIRDGSYIVIKLSGPMRRSFKVEFKAGW